LSDDDPAVVKLVVRYFYKAEYKPELPDGGCMDEVRKIVSTDHSCGSQCIFSGRYCVDFICDHCCLNSSVSRTVPPAPGHPDQLLLHSKICEIADKYDVVDLKQLAREKILRAAAKFWDYEPHQRKIRV
jgi:hypothetical protein